MFGLGKKLFGKGRAARAAMAKMENRDLLQAIVYGVFYVASADGDVEPQELDKIDRLLRAERELCDLTHSPADAEMVLNFMLTIAEADGEIEDAEIVVLERAAAKMNLRLKDYL